MKNNYLAYRKQSSPMSWLQIYCPVAFESYYRKFVEFATNEQVVRLSGFKSMQFSLDRVAFVFPEKTIEVVRSNFDYDLLMHSDEYRDSVIAMFCRLMI